jgi:hypothetical protein
VPYKYVSDSKAILCVDFAIVLGALGSVVVKAVCYKPEGRCFDTKLGDFLNILNSWVYSASNRNEYQKHKHNKVSRE